MSKTNVSKEELLHIAELSDLKLEDNEINQYLSNLDEILSFANTINSIDTANLEETIGSNENYNVFRKDKVVKFEDTDALLANAPEAEMGMFSIPKMDVRG